MKIFPAIDIKDKKCVRLVKGDFNNKTEYDMSPVKQAGKYKDHGFKNLHIVDLDGALTGETVNLDIIEGIVSKFDLKIEIGGGVRNFESIQKYTDVGVVKLEVGSAPSTVPVIVDTPDTVTCLAAVTIPTTLAMIGSSEVVGSEY